MQQLTSLTDARFVKARALAEVCYASGAKGRAYTRRERSAVGGVADEKKSRKEGGCVVEANKDGTQASNDEEDKDECCWIESRTCRDRMGWMDGRMGYKTGR